MNKSVKLVSGNPFKTLLLFSIPMILSVTLQQFYNICDSMIAGKMISDSALSAVSATYPITVVYLAIAVDFSPCEYLTSGFLVKRPIKTTLFMIRPFLCLVVSDA